MTDRWRIEKEGVSRFTSIPRFNILRIKKFGNEWNNLQGNILFSEDIPIKEGGD